MSCIMEGTVCKQCATNGRKAILRLFQINLEEAVWMCPSKECTFPMGAMTIDSMLVKRNVSEMTERKRRKAKVKCPRPMNTTPVLVHSTVTLTRNQTAVVTDKTSVLPQAAESKLSTVVGAADVTTSQTHTSYMTDRRRRTDSASLPPPESSQVPSPAEAVFTPSVDTDLAGLSVPTKSSSSHSVARPGDTSVAKPGDTSVPKPGDTSVPKPGDTSVPKPCDTSVPKPGDTSVAKPCDTSVAKPCDTSVAKPGDTSVPKPGDTSAVCRNPGLASLLNDQVKRFADSTTDRPRRYLQWSNVDALCWMDVALCLLVHCTNLKELVETSGGGETSFVRKLLVQYKEILASWNRIDPSVGASVEETKRLSLETSVGRVSVKTGGGGLDHLVMPPTGVNSGCCAGEKTASPVKLDQHESSVSLATACQMLAKVRDDVLECQPKLRRERGHNHSPVFALPLLLEKVDQAVHDHFRVEFCWRLTCTHCHHCHENRVAKTVTTFPAVPNDFSMSQPCFLRACFKCNSPGQRMNMHIERMPSTLLVHFVEGLFDPVLTNYDFQFGEETYAVTGLIQYKGTPDHFIAWIRDVRIAGDIHRMLPSTLGVFNLHKAHVYRLVANGTFPESSVKSFMEYANHWMMCDDLQHPVCEFSKCAPSFPPSQVHIVMWERQSYRGNPVGVETATHFPTATTDVVTIDGLARIATQTTTGLPPDVSTGLPPGVATGLSPGVATGLPPGVSTGLPPGVSTGLPPGVTVIVTPALVAANTCDVPHQPGTWVAVSPVGSVAPVGTYQSATAPVARNSHVVHGNARTKTGRLTERLQRCREKFERAKAIRPRAVVTPTVTCVRNMQCGQSYAMSRPALPSAQSVVRQSAVTPRLDHCDGQLSLGAHVLSSHKPRGMPTVTCGGVRGAMGVTRSVPVFAGYTAKAHGRKRDVSDVNCSGEINSGVNASSSLNSGVNTSSSANTGANTLTSLNGGVSTLTTAKSSMSRTNTAVSKKRVIRQSGGSVKRRRVSSPPVVSTHDTKCVTSTEPETCHSTQNCQERECVTTQVDTTDDNPDKFADVLDELCSTLDMSDVSPTVHQYDDVIDFDSLLAV